MMLGHGSQVDWFASPATGVATVLIPPMEIEGDAATGAMWWLAVGSLMVHWIPLVHWSTPSPGYRGFQHGAFQVCSTRLKAMWAMRWEMDDHCWRRGQKNSQLSAFKAREGDLGVAYLVAICGNANCRRNYRVPYTPVTKIDRLSGRRLFCRPFRIY